MLRDLFRAWATLHFLPAALLQEHRLQLYSCVIAKVLQVNLIKISFPKLIPKAKTGDALRMTQDDLDAQNFYGWNPAFDKGWSKGKKC